MRGSCARVDPNSAVGRVHRPVVAEGNHPGGCRHRVTLHAHERSAVPLNRSVRQRSPAKVHGTVRAPDRQHDDPVRQVGTAAMQSSSERRAVCLSAIAAPDRQVVMDASRIVESGSPSNCWPRPYLCAAVGASERRVSGLGSGEARAALVEGSPAAAGTHRWPQSGPSRRRRASRCRMTRLEQQLPAQARRHGEQGRLSSPRSKAPARPASSRPPRGPWRRSRACRGCRGRCGSADCGRRPCR